MKIKSLRFIVFMGVLFVNPLKGAEAPSDARYEAIVDEVDPTALVIIKMRPGGLIDPLFGPWYSGRVKIDLGIPLKSIVQVFERGNNKRVIIAKTREGTQIGVEFDVNVNKGEVEGIKILDPQETAQAIQESEIASRMDIPEHLIQELSEWTL